MSKPRSSVLPNNIVSAWWPLALSWMLMGIELPLISMVLARLPDETIQLAAFGGVVFPLALLVEAPVIMMLAASTALCTNIKAFEALQTFMIRLAASMTLLHFVLAFTPLYDIALVPLLDIPADVIEPSRIGFRCMLPWTWAIADRRLNQGILIRFGKRRAVAVGTMVRLLATLLVLVVGWQLQLQGAVLAGLALSCSTIAEAICARIQVQPILQGPLQNEPINDVVVSGSGLWKFYVPLAMTPFLVLAMHPIGAAGIDRMPNPLASLAVWAPLSGIVFICRSSGMAYNEVVIGHSKQPGARRDLFRFAWVGGISCSSCLAIMSFPIASGFWFERIIGLSPELVTLGVQILWIAIPIPLLTFLQSYYQGIIVNAHRTRFITESVLVYASSMVVAILIGVVSQPEYGITAIVLATLIGNVVQTWWLWLRCSTHGLENLFDEQPQAAGRTESYESEIYESEI